jgi:hypothetical protein
MGEWSTTFWRENVTGIDFFDLEFRLEKRYGIQAGASREFRRGRRDQRTGDTQAGER